MSESANFFFAFALGVGVTAFGSALFDRYMSKPHTPKMPKDYRKICECIE